MEFQEREICCCGARTWTLVIGWFEIIGSVLFLLFHWAIWLGFSASLGNSSQYPYMSYDQLRVLNTVFVIIWITAAIVLGLNIFMNIVLLRGVYKKNPHKINAWRIYIKIFLVIFTGIIFVLLFLIVPTDEVLTVVFLTFVIVAVDGFFIWVVGIHKAEIEASTGVTIAYKV